MNTAIFKEAATDTAKLQSAWSAYDPKYYDVVESKSRAKEAFIECVNQFVYFSKLRSPLPETNKGIINPFMELWFENKDDAPYPSDNPFVNFGSYVDINDEKEEILKKNFLMDIERETDKYRSFLQFQFCEKITDEYISRTKGIKIDPGRLIVDSRDLLGDVNSHLKEDVLKQLDSFDLSRWHRDVCKLKLRCSVSEYALSYAYSVFRRGRQYQECLGGSAYDPHWVRAAAQYLDGIDDISNINDPFRGYANWGRIVFGLLEKGHLSEEKNAFKDLLSSIRWSVQSRKHNLNSDSTEDQVKILEKAGKYAKYGKKPLHHTMSKVSKNVLESIPLIGSGLSRLVSVVEMFGKSRPIEIVDAKLTRIMSFRHYEQAFYIPEVVGANTR